MIRELKKRTLSFKKRWHSQTPQKKVVTATITALLIVAFLLFIKNLLEKNIPTEVVKRADLERTITSKGSIIGTADLPLYFVQNKKIVSIEVKENQQVKKNDILAYLSDTKERQDLNIANKELAGARARYDKVLADASNVEIRMAKINLERIKNNQNELVENKRKYLFNDDLKVINLDEDSSFMPPTIYGEYIGDQEGGYTIKYDKKNNKIFYEGLEKGSGIIKNNKVPLGKLGLILVLPNQLPEVAHWKITIPNKDSTNYKENLNAYESSKNTLIKEIAKTQADLDLKKALARQSEIDASLAEILIAQSKVDALTKSYEKTLLRAPVDGTIAEIKINAGEISDSEKIAMTITDTSHLYFESKFNNPEISNINIGQPAILKINEYPYRSYESKVASVVRGDTTISVKYFILNPEKLKIGMTGEVSIGTDKLFNVLVIPRKIVEMHNGIPYVFLQGDKKKKSIVKKIVIGLEGDSNMIEVKEGLEEGDRLIWPETKKKVETILLN